MSFQRIFFVSLILLSLPFTKPAMAQHHDEHGVGETHTTAHEADKGGFNASEVIFGHISDSHFWHLFDFNGHPVSLNLPVIIYHPQKGLSIFSSGKFDHGHASYDGYKIEKGMSEKIVSEDGTKIYDLSITKNVLCLIISVVLLLTIMLSVAKKYKTNGVKTAPTGFQNALEPVITFIRDEVAKPNLGHKYARYMPLLLTMFFFIWINNLLGLLPFGFNFTGNIAVTLCLAIISFIVMIVNANKHFWGHLLNPPGVPTGIKFLLVPIEIISLFIKPVALTIRLFANILAGHIVIISVISMIFIFGSISKIAGGGFVPVSLAFAIFMFFLELLVAAIQAFIFTNLTAVFLGQAIEEAHHHDDHNDKHHHEPGKDFHSEPNTVVA